MKYISHDIDKPITDDEVARELPAGEASEERAKNVKRTALDEFTINLNREAKADRIDPIVGREEEIQRIVQILCRRRKNNPLLVGEAGVGKTAIAEGTCLKNSFIGST